MSITDFNFLKLEISYKILQTSQFNITSSYFNYNNHAVPPCDTHVLSCIHLVFDDLLK